MRKVQIFGVSGFVGHHLAKLLSNDYLVDGFGHADIDEGDQLLDYLEKYTPADLTQANEVEEKVDLDEVEAVFHLAGLAAVGPSFEQPARYISANTSMLINIAEKALKQSSKARFIVVSSGSIYDQSQALPISEKGRLLPTSPYSISKISTELLCEYYRSRGLDMVIARPFNHIGPGQGPGFILPDLVEQAKNYAQIGKFKVGNLKTKRDYTDVRDVVEAYSALAKAKKLNHSIYNICSGSSRSGEEILEIVCEYLDITDPIIDVDGGKIRPNDILDIYGSNALIKEDTGWNPRISIDQSIKDFIENFN